MDDQKKWMLIADKLRKSEPAEWDDLPDLGLYMDQVTGYLNRQLSAFMPDGGEAPLTSSMINNYVKSGHITRPTQKKYSREQLAALYMLCSLKKNLSINDAAALIYFMTEQGGSRGAYNDFIALQQNTVHEAFNRLSSLPPEAEEQDLTALALDLALRACAERLAAEVLITHLIQKDDARIARAHAAAEEKRAAEEARLRAEKEAARAEKK